MKRARKGITRWTEEEDAFVKAQAGVMPAAAIAAELGRAQGAVIKRACGLGLSTLPEAMPFKAFVRAMGVCEERGKRWVEDGWLHAEPWNGCISLVVTATEAERFVRECGWLFAGATLSDPHLRRVADVIYRRNPWLTTTQARRALGLSKTQFYRAARLGLVAVRTCRYGIGGGMSRMVRASDIPAARERIAADAAVIPVMRVANIAAARQAQRRAA